MAWQIITNNTNWEYDTTPPDPGGAETALWQTSANGVRTNVSGDQIYVNCRHRFIHPTQASFPNEINKTFWNSLSPYTLEGRVLDYSTDFGLFIPDQSGEGNNATLYSGRGLTMDAVNDTVTYDTTYTSASRTATVWMRVTALGARTLNGATGTFTFTPTATNTWGELSSTATVSGDLAWTAGSDCDIGDLTCATEHWTHNDWSDPAGDTSNGKTIVDSGPNDYHGTCTGCSGFTGEATIPQTADKNWNAGYYHTGGSAMVIPDFTTFSGQISNATISFWFTLSDVTTTQMLFSLDGGALRTFVSSGTLRVGTGTTVASLSAGTNYFAEINVNGSGNVDTVTLNGVVEHSGAIAHDNTFGDLGIGCRTTADVISLPILGTINNFQIENRASVPLVKGGMAYDSIDFTATYQGKFTFPDGQRSEAGKGITCTGLCIDTNTDTFWVGNHGEEIEPSGTPRNSSIVNMTKAGVKLSEIDLVPILGTTESVQGVAFDPTDNTLFFASTDDNIYHISTVGSLLHTFPITSANGLCYDPVDDVLWVTETAGISEMNKATGAIGRTFANISLVSPDQLAHNPLNDTICATYGNNGSTGQVQTIWKRGGGVQVTSLDATETRSVEGIVFDGTTVWIANDGYFHNTGATNTIQEFLWAESTSSIALETSGLPAATQLISASDANIQIDAFGTAILEPRLNTQQLNLFGEGEYSSTPDSASLDVTTTATWEVWGNFYGVPASTQQILTKQGDAGAGKRSWIIQKLNTGAADEARFLQFSAGDVATIVTFSGIPDSVGMLSFTLDQSSGILAYFNGVPLTVSAHTPAIIGASDAPVVIGSNAALLNVYDDKVGSAKIYNTALTADEVLTNYNTQKSLYGL